MKLWTMSLSLFIVALIYLSVGIHETDAGMAQKIFHLIKPSEVVFPLDEPFQEKFESKFQCMQACNYERTCRMLLYDSNRGVCGLIKRYYPASQIDDLEEQVRSLKDGIEVYQE